MKHYKALKMTLITGMMIVSSPIIAAEVDHSRHKTQPIVSDTNKHSEHDGPHYGVMPSADSKTQLQKLDRIPPSGRTREARSDGRYNMESTTVKNDLQTMCAHGSRGLVMLDNATWKACGGKPQGAAKGAGYYPAIPPWNKEGKGKINEVDHSKHNMH